MRTNNDFGFKIITDGTFTDEGFIIRTVVIRLNSSTLNEWLRTIVLNDRNVYDTREEYEAYKNEKEKLRKALEDKILEQFSFNKIEDGGYCISQNVSEIFTVVMFKKQSKKETYCHKNKQFDV